MNKMTLSLADMIQAAANQEEWLPGSSKKTKPAIVKNGYVNITNANGYSKRIIVNSEQEISKVQAEIQEYTHGAPRTCAPPERKLKKEFECKKNLTFDYQKKKKYLSIALDLELLLRNKNATL